MRPDPSRQPELTVLKTDHGPLDPDWRFCPADWQCGDVWNGAEVAAGVRFFYDDPDARLSCKAAPHGIDISLAEFSGDFLSLAIDVPPEALMAVSPWHLWAAEIELPSAGFLRLNCMSGAESFAALAPVAAGRAWGKVDLVNVLPAGQPIDRAWLDVILDKPAPGTTFIYLHEVRRAPPAAM